MGRWVLTADGLRDGFIVVEDGRLKETVIGKVGKSSTRSVIIPGLVNAHTHVADSVAYPAPKGTVQEIVGPPDGYKHRRLREVGEDEKAAAISDSVRLMLGSGTTHFADFREEGLAGVEILINAIPVPAPRATVLGRPSSPEASDDEITAILSRCQGIGMSALRDWPIDMLERVSRMARSAGKIFALHASETAREDIDEILRLKPNFVVHMTSATPEDIRVCADSGVGIVVCPRANAFFGITPDLPMMLEAGATVCLGTDNGMISRPNMLDEVQAAYRISRKKGGLTPVETLNLATFSGRKVLNQPGKILMELDTEPDLTVIGVRSGDPLLEIVSTSGSGDVEAVILGGKVWRSESWTK